jgi:hypothetical protein
MPTEITLEDIEFFKRRIERDGNNINAKMKHLSQLNSLINIYNSDKEEAQQIKVQVE